MANVLQEGVKKQTKRTRVAQWSKTTNLAAAAYSRYTFIESLNRECEAETGGNERKESHYVNEKVCSLRHFFHSL